MFGKLLLLFIIVPILELSIFMLLSDVVSIPVTLGIIIITGAIGAYLTKQQGGLALRNFQGALQSGKLPHEEATDGILILIAGAVLLTPGFLTDAVGFSLLVPSIRSVFKRLLSGWVKSKISVNTAFPTSHSAEEPVDLKQAKGRVIDS